MTEFRIREFVPDTDNSGVVAVARTLSIPARVRLGIDRSPEYTAFNRAAGEPCEIVVADAAGEIVGFLEFCTGRFRMFNRVSFGVHCPLGGVRPDWRRRGVLRALRAEALRLAQLMGAQWACILVNINNRPMREYLHRSFPRSITLNPLLVHGILTAWLSHGGSSDSSYHIGPLHESEWPELLDFVAEGMHSYDVFPELDSLRWRSLPGCSTADYRVARDSSGRIVASLGSWDPSAFKRPLVLGYGRLEHALLKTMNLLLTGAGVQPFPQAGERLRVLYTLCPLAAPGHEKVLGRMIARLRRDSRPYTGVLVALPEGDPRNRLMRRFCHFTNVNIPFVIPLTTAFEEELSSHPPKSIYIEYAFM